MQPLAGAEFGAWVRDVKKRNRIIPKPVPTGAISGNPRSVLTLDEAAADADVCYRFLQMEIQRGRLVATRLSARIVRIRRADWETYLSDNATGRNANAG